MSRRVFCSRDVTSSTRPCWIESRLTVRAASWPTSTEGWSRRENWGSYVHDGFWWEFGTPEHYLDGSLRLFDLPLERRIAVSTHDAIREINGGVAAMGAGAVLQDGARLEGRVALGLACLVGKGSGIKDSVIMPEAWIGPGSRLERVVVGPGVEIPANSNFRNALICGKVGSGCDSGPGVRQEGDLLVYDFASERLPTE